MSILGPNWDSILTFSHKHFHSKGHGSSLWPVQIEQSFRLAGLRTETSEKETGIILCAFYVGIYIQINILD